MSPGRDIVSTFGVGAPFLYFQCALPMPSTVRLNESTFEQRVLRGDSR